MHPAKASRYHRAAIPEHTHGVRRCRSWYGVLLAALLGAAITIVEQSPDLLFRDSVGSIRHRHVLSESLRLRGGGAVQSMLPRNFDTRVLVAVGGTMDGKTALQSMESMWHCSAGRSARGSEVVRKWRKDKARMSCGRDSLAVAACGSRIYAIGGYNGTVELSSVESIDLSRTQPRWEIQPRMRKRRGNVGAAVVGQRLFVIGGYNGTHDLPNVEVLDLDSDGARKAGVSWQWGPQLTYRRSGAAVTTLGDKIYAVGGYDGRRLQETAEELTATSTTWQPLPSLLSGPRGGAAAASVAGRVYVIGGAGPGGRTAGMESLDPREGRWRMEQPMSVVRSGPAAIGMEACGQIVVLGGFDGQRQLRSVEVFDARKNTWTRAADMRSPRWGSGLVAVHSACRIQES